MKRPAGVRQAAQESRQATRPSAGFEPAYGVSPASSAPGDDLRTIGPHHRANSPRAFAGVTRPFAPASVVRRAIGGPAGSEAISPWKRCFRRSPDHLSIIDQPRPGYFVLAAGGHGMLCGPGLGLKTPELIAISSRCEVPGEELHLARVAAGHAVPTKDQIALPFPVEA